MRYIKRQVKRQQPKLIRGADGKLRPPDQEGDIGDIWAEQRRIKLAEAIQEDKRRVEKKKQRKERLRNILSKKPSVVKVKSAGQSKEIVLSVGMPKIKLPKLSLARLRRWEKRYLVAAGSALALVLAVFSIGIASHFNSGKSQNKPDQNSADVLGSKKGPTAPDYQTVLPKGKNIKDLGGWGLVSPPGKPPVFAYVDTIDTVQINVSQQPMPESFKKDTAGETAKLAAQFTANQKLTAGDTTFYVGTSIKGPQSAVFTKDGLLILIKSSAKLTDQQWTDYVASLD